MSLWRVMSVTSAAVLAVGISNVAAPSVSASPSAPMVRNVQFSADSPGVLAAMGVGYAYAFTATDTFGGPPTYTALDPLPTGLSLDPSTGLLSGVPTAAGSYTFTIEAHGDGTEVDAPPTTITVAQVGDVFIADKSNQVLDTGLDGGSQDSIASGLDDPEAVAVDAAGDVYIADAGNNRVVEVPTDGDPQITVGTGLSHPHGVAVDPIGDVFIADSGNGRIVEVPSGGGSQTTVIGSLSLPTGVAVDLAGNLFISDSISGTVVEQKAAGGTVTVASGLSQAAGVAVDAAGDVYAADEGSGAVIEVPAGGGPQSAVGRNLSTPSSVAVDADGDVFIADAGNNQVTEVPAGTTFQGAFSSIVNPEAVAIYTVPPTFTADSPTLAAVGTPYRYDYAAIAPGNEPVVTFAVASGTLPPGLSLDPASGGLSGTPTTPGTSSFAVEAENAAAGAISPTTTLTVMGFGDVAVADFGSGQVDFVQPDGETSKIPVDDVFSPEGVALDGAGDLFTADAVNHSVLELPADGSSQTGVGSGLDSPLAVAADPAGDVVVADTDNDRVVEVPAGGGDQTTVLDNADDPEGVAIDALGDVYVSEFNDNQVIEVPAGGGPHRSVGTGLDQPTGLAVDAAGNLYIANTGAQQVIKVPADGGAQTTIGSGFTAPQAVALDAAGDIFVLDTTQVVELPAGGGPQQTLASGFSQAYGVATFAPPPRLVAATPATSLTVGKHFSYRFVASALVGEPSPSFRVATGALPPGLSLDPAGLLAGDPTKAGQYTFTVEAMNKSTGALAAPITMTVRRNPTITATITSPKTKPKAGWYRASVTVTFHCTVGTAPLVAPCPRPVTLSASKARQSVTRTITATDGGTAAVTKSGINIDKVKPTVAIHGPKAGKTYRGHAPKATCIGHDKLSGIASCRITRRTSGKHVTLTAIATDKAGNVARRTLKYILR
jgi:sugar lactone lactonase YvrE